MDSVIVVVAFSEESGDTVFGPFASLEAAQKFIEEAPPKFDDMQVRFTLDPSEVK